MLRMRTFIAYLAATAAFGGILFGYIGASSFVLQDSFGLTPQQYSLVFALNAVGIFVASNVSRHWSARVRTAPPAGQRAPDLRRGRRRARPGRRPAQPRRSCMAGLFLAVASLGLVIPAATTLGMAAAVGRAGSASGVLGICQFTVGAIAAPLAGAGGSPWSLVVVDRRRRRRRPVLRLHLLRTCTREHRPHPSDTRRTA